MVEYRAEVLGEIAAGVSVDPPRLGGENRGGQRDAFAPLGGYYRQRGRQRASAYAGQVVDGEDAFHGVTIAGVYLAVSRCMSAFARMNVPGTEPESRSFTIRRGRIHPRPGRERYADQDPADTVEGNAGRI